MTDPTAREVFNALAAEHLQRPGADRRAMFGRDCLRVDGHNVAFFHEDLLVFKLPPPTAAALLDRGEAVIAHMRQRVMRSWVAVALPPDGTTDCWHSLLDQAVAHASRSSTP